MKIKKGKNEGIYFVFNDVFIVYGLIVFCIFYGFCFGVFDFFFGRWREEIILLLR